MGREKCRLNGTQEQTVCSTPFSPAVLGGDIETDAAKPYDPFFIVEGATNAQIGSVSSNLDWAKKKCGELGFKSGTERFGNCVLQLSRDEIRPSTPVTSAGPLSSQGNAPSAPATTAVPKVVGTSPKIKLFKDCDDCPEMVAIPAGSFLMGSKADPFATSPPSADEIPEHAVSIKAFSLGKFEVTQEQWYALMGNLPSQSKGRTLPVTEVSWDDAQAFIKKLNEKTGKQYRLPSEAEWEYACRAGGQAEYCGSDRVDDVGWYDANSGVSTQPVAGLQANAWGLHDMSGNVWEWTEDCWNESYSGVPANGSAWRTGDCSLRVVRGGSMFSTPRPLRAASRIRISAAFRSGTFGFRVARTH